LLQCVAARIAGSTSIFLFLIFFNQSKMLLSDILFLFTLYYNKIEHPTGGSVGCLLRILIFWYTQKKQKIVVHERSEQCVELVVDFS